MTYGTIQKNSATPDSDEEKRKLCEIMSKEATIITFEFILVKGPCSPTVQKSQ